ncbi:MAG: ACT domain-containing protein [Neisseriaceae bacterium]
MNTPQYMYVISIISQNKLCVLQRIAGVFSRYRINIEHLNVSRHSENLSYWNVVIYSNDTRVELLINQLQKVIDLVSIKVIDKVDAL